MSEDFSIENKLGPALRLFFHSQLFRTPSYPVHSFADQTIIITGANVGLGLEAARHFYRLNCARLILAVRSVPKGQTEKEDILQSVTHRIDAAAIEVWQLDLSNTISTLAFAQRANKELSRVDVVIENAGVNIKSQTMAEGIEQTLQVNVIKHLPSRTIAAAKDEGDECYVCKFAIAFDNCHFGGASLD
jgi:NAD(P)-dependent dehydrogenase (short-subunit alcohol dehydrogenase family)